MNRSSRKLQQGAALAIALVILVVTTLIALTAARLTGMEMKMSGGAAQYAAAQQDAESVMDAVITGSALDLAISDSGYSSCSAEWPTAMGTSTQNACSNTSLTLPADVSSKTGDVAARIAYVGAIDNLDLPPRVSEAMASSVTARAALFDVRVQYKPTDANKADVEYGAASTGVAEGLIRLYAVPK